MPVTVFTDLLSEPVAPGITRSRLEPGGKDGPEGFMHACDQIGGGTWSQSFALGRADDEWRMIVPDIRMAPNQIWPLHWHDCWTAVVVLDGSLMMGDWWMYPGDLLIAQPGVEYGLLLNGPKGCQLLEIFARDILSPGGYGEEYRDHPTLVHLKGVDSIEFFSRPPALVENGYRQVVPVDATPGLAKGHLDGNGCWDLGAPGDPERGVVSDRMLSSGERVPTTSGADWRAALVLDGSMAVGDTAFAVNDMLLVEPDAMLPDIVAGAGGVHLLELARTATALLG